MVKIGTKLGLDIPLAGSAADDVRECLSHSTIACDLSSFSNKARLRAIAKVGDQVIIGESLAHDAHNSNRVFTSPASGVVKEIVRGKKRRLLSIVIKVDEKEDATNLSPLEENASKKEVVDALFLRGASPHIFSRPFQRLISQEKMPRLIFISAIASAPLASPIEIQLRGEEKLFQKGLTLLSKIAPVHLVANNQLFEQFDNVTHHKAVGPHPVGQHSIHIEQISPIQGLDDCVWTLDIHGVIAIGALLGEGRHVLHRIVAVTGTGFKREARTHYRVRIGSEVNSLIQDGIEKHIDRVIVGDVLAGKQDSPHLGFFDSQIFSLLSPPRQKLMPFTTFGFSRYTAFRTYVSKFRFAKKFNFSARLMGEKRPIVDGSLYRKVMPLNIHVEPFIKALMAKDYEMAIQLGLLDVIPEDFALCEFICPSKTPFTEIVAKGIDEYLELYGSAGAN